jgi:endothelin-converting enzyme
MELGFVESDREKPLVKIINNLGGWEVLRSFNLYSWDSHRVLKRLHAEYYVNAFFRVEVVADVRDPARNIIRISPDGLGMPHKSFYHRLPTDPAVQAYQTFLKDSAQLFGAARYESQFRSPDFFNLKTLLFREV